MSIIGDRAVAALRALMSEPLSGDRLDGRFELGEVIGEGAMGVVYAAWDRETERAVAIKMLRADDEHARHRFAREVAALGEIRHPAVVRYVAHGVHGSAQYVAIDRLVGCTLADRLTRGSLTVSETSELGARIADGLAAVHRAGIAHRDIKPSNIFLVDEAASGACLLDFSLARGRDEPVITEAGALLGTPGYMAPEQIRGAPSVGARADVFALGCVLFECLTERAPFRGATTETLLAEVLLSEPPRLRALRSDVPDALEQIVEQMIAKQAISRPNAEDVARELAALGTDGPLRAVESPGRSEPAPGLAEGTVVAGKYRVERRIGEGGMGIVVAARHLELGTRVALKLLRRHPGADDVRFLREAQAAARLESEHVARVLDFGRMADATPYIVMEYLSGVDLGRRLVEQGPLGVEAAVGYVLDACEAIAEAHSLGIIHRDLKPSNLFLVSRRNRKELVKVLDFGISKVTQPLAESTLTESTTGRSQMMGSVWYMSPEQLHDSRRVDARADIWALGVVLHELITGSRPFDASSAGAVGARIAATDPRRLRDVVKDAPAALESVILRCLEKDPARRFPDVASLAHALAPFAKTRPGWVERTGGTREPRPPPGSPRFGRGRIAITVTLLTAVGALTIGSTLSRKEEPPLRALSPATSSPRAAGESAGASRSNEAAQRELSTTDSVVTPAPFSLPNAADAAAPRPLAATSSHVATSSTNTPMAQRSRAGTVTVPSSLPTAVGPSGSARKPTGIDLRDPAFQER